MNGCYYLAKFLMCCKTTH